MNSIYLIIDESGAKGYSDNVESEYGEFGVMAGYVLPSEMVTIVRNDLDEITSSYAGDGKLHITDLLHENQEKLRNDIFEYLKIRNIYWLYNAIYVQGFHENYLGNLRLINKAKENRKSKIKISNNKRKNLLHSELFLGIFGKGLAFGCERLGQNLNVNIITDKVDDAILKGFNEIADKFLNIGKPNIKEVKGFDPTSKKIVTGEIKTEIIDEHNLLGDFSEVKYNITREDSSLTLVADILSNSVCYYIKKSLNDNDCIALNSPEAVKEHPLANLIFGTSSDFSGTYIPDAIYQHPSKIKK